MIDFLFFFEMMIEFELKEAAPVQYKRTILN